METVHTIVKHGAYGQHQKTAHVPNVCFLDKLTTNLLFLDLGKIGKCHKTYGKDV